HLDVDAAAGRNALDVLVVVGQLDGAAGANPQAVAAIVPGDVVTVAAVLIEAGRRRWRGRRRRSGWRWRCRRRGRGWRGAHPRRLRRRRWRGRRGCCERRGRYGW